MAKSYERHTEDSGMFDMDSSQHNGRSLSRLGSELVPEIFSNEQVIRLVALISNHTSTEDQLLQTVRRCKPLCVLSSAGDCAVLAQLLREEDYLVTEHGPGTENASRRKGNNCLESLHHDYLTCTGTSRLHWKEELIVEPRFKEQFQIAHSTAKYQELLSVLPAEYVGTAEALTLIVEAISQAAAEAFQEQGMAVPPWRRAAATLSKWALEPSQSQGVKATKPVEQQRLPMTEVSNFGFNIPSAQPASTMPPKARRSTELLCSPMRGKSFKRVSLLAKGIADMAALQKSPCKRKSEPSAKSEKLRRGPSWDFSGLPPITTVRRAGKAR